MPNTRIQGLYAITDSELLSSDQQLFSAVESALRGGLACLQYRDKTADASKALRQARELASLCSSQGTLFIINDDVYLARACEADGVHLGQTDGCLRHAREFLGKNKLLGRTCHNRLDLAAKAAQEGVDYLAFGRCYPSSTKPQAPAASLQVFARAAYLGLPRVAIGGINSPERAQEVYQAGADLIAAVEGIFAQENPEQAVLSYHQALQHRAFQHPATQHQALQASSLNSSSIEVIHDSLSRTL